MSLFRKQNKRFVTAFGIRNMEIDFCKYLTGKVSSNLMTRISGELKRRSNILHSCPLAVRTLYYLCFCKVFEI